MVTSGYLWLLLVTDLSYSQHHCRRCGKIVCNNCSLKRLLLPSQSSEPVRVCDPCFAEASAKRISDVKNDSSGDDDSDDNGAGNREVIGF